MKKKTLKEEFEREIERKRVREKERKSKIDRKDVLLFLKKDVL